MNQPTNEPNYTTVMIIWGAMVFAVVPNVIVAVMIAEPKEEPFEQTIIAVMCLMAVFNLALSVGIRRWASQPARCSAAACRRLRKRGERQFPIPMQHGAGPGRSPSRDDFRVGAQRSVGRCAIRDRFGRSDDSDDVRVPPPPASHPPRRGL